MKSLVILACVLSACGSLTKSQPRSLNLASLAPKIEALRAWVPTCEGFVSKGECDQGDIALFAGLTCLGGEELACQTVKNSIGADGKIWRSPKAVNKDTKNSASRDMFIGVMAYVIATKDADALTRVSDYLAANDNMLCQDATDGRCKMTDNVKNLLDHARIYLGLPALQSVKGYSQVLVAQASITPVGFELHLVGLQMLLLKKVGVWNESLQYGSEYLVSRQAENPFFALVAFGASEQFVAKMDAQIPTSAPSAQNQWSFERRDDEKAWKASMGWEFIAIYGLAKNW